MLLDILTLCLTIIGLQSANSQRLDYMKFFYVPFVTVIVRCLCQFLSQRSGYLYFWI